jgi:hypothetical protein
MGNSIGKSFGRLFGLKEVRILMLGLDAAGKTSEYTRCIAFISLVTKFYPPSKQFYLN